MSTSWRHVVSLAVVAATAVSGGTLLSGTPMKSVDPLPLVVTTWAVPCFQTATEVAFRHYERTGDRLASVVEGCTTAERLQCDGSVGYGGSPDENGESSLDALLLDGPGQKMGAVVQLRRVKSASKVAWAVMNYTKVSILAGEAATEFAREMGFKVESLYTPSSVEKYQQWLNNSCQPNYRKNVTPNAHVSCGPYTPMKWPAKTPEPLSSDDSLGYQKKLKPGERPNHDTIGMVLIDENGHVSAATSTNGASHKIPGRVGDSGLSGAGAYVDDGVGGAAATGDGDVMLRFLPTYQAVEGMRQGMKPDEACRQAIARIACVYPHFSGAVVAADKKGRHGAACNGIYGSKSFTYSVFNRQTDQVQLFSVNCTGSANPE